MRVTHDPNQPDQALLDIHAVATVCDCSVRHIRRLAEQDRMPSPVRLGALLRWRRADIDRWIEAGCPAAQGAPEGSR